MQRLFILSILSLLLMQSVQTQGTRTQVDVSRLGPQVGERVPDFRLRDQLEVERAPIHHGAPWGDAVFVRSADW